MPCLRVRGTGSCIRRSATPSSDRPGCTRVDRTVERFWEYGSHTPDYCTKQEEDTGIRFDGVGGEKTLGNTFRS